MIYTIVPIEQVLAEDVRDKSWEQNVAAFYMGEQVSLLRGNDGEYRVDRLLSTNPQRFLKTEFYPGAKADIDKIKLI